MSTSFQPLYEFITAAEKNRNYPPGTASGSRAALKLVESELTDEEQESLDIFRSRIDQIFNTVYHNKKSQYSAETIETYKKRVKRLLNDYDAYGSDPSKMASWNRTIRVRSVKTLQKDEQPMQGRENSTLVESKDVEPATAMTRFELPLRAGIKAIVLTPSDLTLTEALKLRAYVSLLETLAIPDKEVR